MANNTALTAVKGCGWLNGFGNFFGKRNHDWWGTWQWLIQIVIWLVIINGLLAGATSVNPQVTAAQDRIKERQVAQGSQVTNLIPSLPQTILTIFFVLSGIAPAIGVIILGQDALIGERQNGTATWVLSKPISRAAFVLSKFSSDALGILVTMVLIQGIVASQVYRFAVGEPLPFFWFTAGLGLLYLLLLFYLSLTYMLGSLFRSRGPVLGISIILVFGNQLASIAPWLGRVMPWNLVMDLGPKQPSLAIALVNGRPLPTIAPIIGTLLLTLTFMIVTLWRFQREDF